MSVRIGVPVLIRLCWVMMVTGGVSVLRFRVTVVWLMVVAGLTRRLMCRRVRVVNRCALVVWGVPITLTGVVKLIVHYGRSRDATVTIPRI